MLTSHLCRRRVRGNNTGTDLLRSPVSRMADHTNIYTTYAGQQPAGVSHPDYVELDTLGMQGNQSQDTGPSGHTATNGQVVTDQNQGDRTGVTPDPGYIELDIQDNQPQDNGYVATNGQVVTEQNQGNRIGVTPDPGYIELDIQDNQPQDNGYVAINGQVVTEQNQP